MKKKIVAGMLALTMALAVTACGDSKDADKKDPVKTEKEEKTDRDSDKKVTAKRGTFEGNVYTNKSMGVQVTFPEGCTMYSDEEIKQVVGAGTDVMEEAYDSEIVENSLAGTIYDVIAVTGDQSTNIQIVMEDTVNTAGMTLSADIYAKAVANNMKKAYEAAGVSVSDAEITDETLGGLDFAKVSIAVNGMTQEYYAHQVENYMFVFTITYTDASADVVQQFLDSVKAL